MCKITTKLYTKYIQIDASRRSLLNVLIITNQVYDCINWDLFMPNLYAYWHYVILSALIKIYEGHRMLNETSYIHINK